MCTLYAVSLQMDVNINLLQRLQAEDDEEQAEDKQPSLPSSKRAAPAASSAADEEPSTSAPAAEASPQFKKPKFSKLGKDPQVSTSFLPDKDRELQEEELRQKLKKASLGSLRKDNHIYASSMSCMGSFEARATAGLWYGAGGGCKW